MGRMGLHGDCGAALCGLHVVYNMHRFHAFRIIGGGRPFHVIGFVDFMGFHTFSLSCSGGPSVCSMSLVFMDFIDFMQFHIRGLEPRPAPAGRATPVVWGHCRHPLGGQPRFAHCWGGLPRLGLAWLCL